MAASPRARFTPLTRADLDEIWRYTFGRWSPDQADRYHQEIVGTAGALAAGAKVGRAVEIRAGYLRYAVGSPLIFYRQTEAGIDVIRVLHQRMDVPSRLS
ncbi:type II toxin-antitoxin system RelE/ParE family toxin [Methylobacterium sp. J-001]|uniref:type II toxin-antitoxin system RelE/ParE family toxin n=1 Tax=Methylobacterium sp. J-001 TaxID=2836609 RepID=UPI001FB98992|nr:type II toxin-antitoxin system RelE/ParE family toxin [Methylobacterium sp. J-001]MCJ2115616.1 type II toxin-antitoxin system RelE/ParE family toxin [Methylobacterium sp. J-001]